MNSGDDTPILQPTWQSGDLQPRSLGHEIHIWRLHRDRLPGCPELLTAEERARTEALLDPQQRQRQRATQTTVRRLLSSYLKIEPRQLHLLRSDQGKPCLSERPLSFNLSHSAELALLAISAAREVGIDLEPLSPGRNLAAISRRLFDADTALEISRLSAMAQTERFLWHWTRFEAQQKMTGAGIFGHRQLPPHQLLSFQPQPGWLAAIAVQGEAPLQLHFHEYSP